jgi:3'-phosphoadenosine 5'-phosphosulfate sulfotransferase (PAPS reductase)/FAD synthetase
MRRFLQGVEGPKVVFDGIRAAESRLRATYVPVWYHPSFRCISASPLFGWSNEKVVRFIEDGGLPLSPVAGIGTSGECWCGAYKGKADFEALLKIHPEIFNKLVTVEKAQRGKYTFIYEDGERIPLATLRAPRNDKQSSQAETG